MRLRLVWALLVLAGCDNATLPALTALPAPRGTSGTASPRVDGRLGTTDTLPPPSLVITGEVRATTPPQSAAGSTRGDISLDFVDADIREVVSQVLGALLRMTYAIDPAVRGTATLRTASPIPQAQLLPALQALLAQNGAALVQSNGIYRVLPAAAAAGSAVPSNGDTTDGGVIELRYASAEDAAPQPVRFGPITGACWRR